MKHKKKSAPRTQLVDRKRQKMAQNSNCETFSANYGCCWPIIDLFLTQYDNFRPETYTNSVVILVEAFWVVFGLKVWKG